MSNQGSSKGRPQHHIKIAETKDEIEAAYDIRLEVFHVEQGFPADTEIDEYDPISIHFLLYTTLPSPPDSATTSLLPQSLQPKPEEKKETIKPIGTIRFTPSIGKVSRLAVGEEYRQHGFGRVLVEAVDEYVKGLQGGRRATIEEITREVNGQQVVQLKLHAQMPVIPFYQKYGYRTDGDVFDEEGAPHQKMVKDIIIE